MFTCLPLYAKLILNDGSDQWSFYHLHLHHQGCIWCLTGTQWALVCFTWFLINTSPAASADDMNISHPSRPWKQSSASRAGQGLPSALPCERRGAVMAGCAAGFSPPGTLPRWQIPNCPWGALGLPLAPWLSLLPKASSCPSATAHGWRISLAVRGLCSWLYILAWWSFVILYWNVGSQKYWINFVQFYTDHKVTDRKTAKLAKLILPSHGQIC